jgi:hypothetical protein
MEGTLDGSDDGCDDGRGDGEAAAPDADDASQRDSDRNYDRDYDRDLGVIEAITVVTRSCPNGGVTRAAKGALEAIKTGGPDTLKEQAYFVLIAIKGWRGERARQVHRSLSRYLDPDTPNTGTSKQDSHDQKN